MANSPTFLQIKKHDGVFMGDSPIDRIPVYDFLINLGLVFQVVMSSEKSAIHFFLNSNFREAGLSILFEKEGHGEFERMKRIIESHIAK